jgi:tetrahydromethanopterin S-methyltransferase subunit F
MVRRELRYNAIKGCFEMAELRELDKEDDEVIDMHTSQQIRTREAHIKQERRERVKDVAAGFVLGVVLIGLVCLVLSGALR